MKTWIVLLESGIWAAPWRGDPGRTLVRATAKRHKSITDAMRTLGNARRYRPFPRAHIEEYRQ